MGVQAVATYDAVGHRPLVLRASNPSLYSIIVETLGSFTHHIDSLLGIATTPTEVSALWGGPPNVSYTVVGRRYRVIVVWEDNAADVDVAVSVAKCLEWLAAAVQRVLSALNRGNEDAVLYLCDIARKALGRVEALPAADPEVIVKRAKGGEGIRGLIKRSSTSLKGLPSPSSRGRSGQHHSSRNIVAGIDERGGVGTARLSKVRSSRRAFTVFFGKGQKPDRARPVAMKSSLEGGKESHEVVARGSDAVWVPESENEIKVCLPEEVFKWADFGGPLPRNPGDLSWFVDLFGGIGLPRRRAQRSAVVKRIERKKQNFVGDEFIDRTGSIAQETPGTEEQGRASGKRVTLYETNVNGDKNKEPTSSGSRTSELLRSKPVMHSQDLVRAHMNAFANSMQAGNFQLALKQTETALEVLAGLNPRRSKEILTCANYKMAQKILIRIRAIEEEVKNSVVQNPNFEKRRVEAAVLTMVLASLKGLLPRHRLAATRMAVEKNMAVGNYGICAGWLNGLIEKAPGSQKHLLLQQLQICHENKNANARMPPFNRLCYLTLSLIPPPALKCNFCPAAYNPRLSGVVANQACATCLVGTVTVSP